MASSPKMRPGMEGVGETLGYRTIVILPATF